MRQRRVYSLADKSVAPVVSLKLRLKDAEQRPGLSPLRPSLYFRLPFTSSFPQRRADVSRVCEKLTEWESVPGLVWHAGAAAARRPSASQI